MPQTGISASITQCTKDATDLTIVLMLIAPSAFASNKTMVGNTIPVMTLIILFFEAMLYISAQGADVIKEMLTTLSVLPQYQPPPLDVRYRGPTAIADTANTGIVNGERMHIGNFVMFTGVSVGRWQTARLMQWDGNLWHLLPVEANRDKYMLALNDLTHNAPEGVFSTAFIRTLFADMAIIGILEILCTIRSANFSETEGWQLDSSGRAILRDALDLFRNQKER